MVLITLGGCHLLDGLVVVSVEARKEDCTVLWRSDCEGIVLTPREPRRATLVERDTKGDKWFGRVKVLELVVSTPHGRMSLTGHH